MKSYLLATMLVAAGIGFNAPRVSAQNAAAASPPAKLRSATDAKDQVRVTRVTPEYWRVTFHNPPFNIYGPNTTLQLNRVVTAIEADPQLKVVVFESAVPGFFLTHYDFVRR